MATKSSLNTNDATMPTSRSLFHNETRGLNNSATDDPSRSKENLLDDGTSFRAPTNHRTASDDDCNCPSETGGSGEEATRHVRGGTIPKSAEALRQWMNHLPQANWSHPPYPPEMLAFKGNLLYYPAYDPAYDYKVGDPACYPSFDKVPKREPSLKCFDSLERAYDYYNPGGYPYRYPDYDLAVEPSSLKEVSRQSSTCSCEVYSDLVDLNLGTAGQPPPPSPPSEYTRKRVAAAIVRRALDKARKQFMMEHGIWEEDQLKPKKPKIPNYVAEHVYVDPVGDPYKKAIKYIEKHGILQLFQKLTADIVYERPKDPVDFIISEIEVLKRNKPASSVEMDPFIG